LATISSVATSQMPHIEGDKLQSTVTRKVLEDFIKEYKIQINDKLNAENKFQQLLYNYKDIFAMYISEMKTHMLKLHEPV